VICPAITTVHLQLSRLGFCIALCLSSIHAHNITWAGGGAAKDGEGADPRDDIRSVTQAGWMGYSISVGGWWHRGGAVELECRANATQHNATQRNATQHNTTQRNATQHTTTHPTTPHHTTPQPTRWVREELHRWVFDNIRSKWPQVLRRPVRLMDLFSGYHASRCALRCACAWLQQCGCNGVVATVVHCERTERIPDPDPLHSTSPTPHPLHPLHPPPPIPTPLPPPKQNIRSLVDAVSSHLGIRPDALAAESAGLKTGGGPPGKESLPAAAGAASAASAQHAQHAQQQKHGVRLAPRSVFDWGEADLHRLVAHFLSVRFPILLALNKVRLLSVLILFCLCSVLF